MSIFKENSTKDLKAHYMADLSTVLPLQEADDLHNLDMKSVLRCIIFVRRAFRHKQTETSEVYPCLLSLLSPQDSKQQRWLLPFWLLGKLLVPLHGTRIKQRNPRYSGWRTSMSATGSNSHSHKFYLENTFYGALVKFCRSNFQIK